VKLKPLVLAGFLLLALILVSEIQQVKGTPVEISLTLLEDCEVRSPFPDTNYGSSIYIHAINTTDEGGKERFSYLKFNLTEIPTAQTIINATLYIYCQGQPSGGWGKISVHPVANQSWLESNITWNYRPPVNATVLDVSALNTSLTWWNWDMTAYVTEKYLAGADSNISTAHVNNHRAGTPGWFGAYFRSSEYTGSFAPQLNVTYEDLAPLYHYPYGLNSTLNGTICQFTVNFTDDVGLSHALLSWNNSGSWANISYALSGTVDLALWNQTLNATEAVRIEYLFYVNDTSNNWNTTLQHFIYTNTKPVVVVADDSAILFTGVIVVASLIGCMFILGRRKK